MTSDALNSLVHEVYAAHVILHMVGVPSDDVYVSVQHIINAPSRWPYVVLIVRRHGKQFVLHFGTISSEEDREQFLTGWRTFAELKPNLDKRELDEIVMRSEARKNMVVITAALIRRGIVAERVLH